MSTPTGHVVVWEGASLVQVKSHYTKFKKPHTGGGKRNKVNGFSHASRKRMMVLLNKIREDALRSAKLITLTYRRNEITTEELKANFKAFREHLRRNYPNGSGIWKLEYQQRGSPHWHILWLGEYMGHQRLAEVWNRIAEDGDNLHLQAGTEVRSAIHSRSVGSYLTKYLGKVDGGTEARSSIRHWGVINRKCLPLGTKRVFPCSGSVAREIIVRECAKRSLGPHGESVERVDLFERNSRGTGSWLKRFEGASENVD